MIDAVRRAMTPITRRVMSMAARCRVQLADETSGRQRLQVSALSGEVLSEVEMIGHYGFTSSPLPGALAAVTFPTGARDSGFVLGTDDSRYRPVGLAPGEVCIYGPNGAQILLQADGSIIVVAGAAGMTVNGNEAITDALSVGGTVTTHSTMSIGGDTTIAGNLQVEGTIAAGGLGTAAAAALVEAVGTPGVNTNVPTEEAVRSAIAAIPVIQFQTDSFAVAGADYVLTHNPSGALTMIYLDGVLQPATEYSVAGSDLTLAGDVDLTAIETVTAVYTY